MFDNLNYHLFQYGCYLLCSFPQVKLYAGPGMIRLGQNLTDEMKPAKNLSYEYGDLECTVELVESVDEAIEYIGSYGSAHTESIVTEDSKISNFISYPMKLYELK